MNLFPSRLQVLNRFLNTKARSSQLGTVSPIADGAEDVSSSRKDTRLGMYGTGRDHADKDTTSRLRSVVLSSLSLLLASNLTSLSLNLYRSPYFASGVISARQVLAETARQSPGGKLPVDKKASATGTWVSEIAWREFYNHIIAAYPRVSMGQPFNVKYRGVQWETDPKYLQAWKEGKTVSLFFPVASRLVDRRSLSSSFSSTLGIPHRRCCYATV